MASSSRWGWGHPSPHVTPRRLDLSAPGRFDSKLRRLRISGYATGASSCVFSVKHRLPLPKGQNTRQRTDLEYLLKNT